jgi:hypothetical protein
MTDFNKMSEPVKHPAENVEEMIDLFHNDLISGHHGDVRVMAMVTMTEQRKFKIFLFGGQSGSITEATALFSYALHECYLIQTDK